MCFAYKNTLSEKNRGADSRGKGMDEGAYKRGDQADSQGEEDPYKKFNSF